jgi:N-acetylmuramoyl-L-alanine amidase
VGWLSCDGRLWRCILVSSLAILFLSLFAADAAAQDDPPICLWSDHGPVAVDRNLDRDPKSLLLSLVAGPDARERARGLRTAIPPSTSLRGLELRADSTAVVRLAVPLQAARSLDHETFEALVQQIGCTLQPAGWRDLRIETWDPVRGSFVPLADYLPDIVVPHKPPLDVEGEGTPAGAPATLPVSFSSQGALAGKTVYVSAGHGWGWYSSVEDWRTARVPYPNPPYVDPIIEDHNNAEAVNQYLLRYLENAGATVIPVRERDMNEHAVIVDNDAPAPGMGYAETGAWHTTNYTGTGYAGTDYRWAETTALTPTATAVWTATLPTSSTYAVYAWYRHGGNRAPDAHYTVHHAGGTTDVFVDQRIHGDTWRYLGTFGFRGDVPARVVLSNRSGADGVVVADAIRFGGGTFDDLAGIETAAPYAPNVPWWETAAFYYTQRMGMDAPPGDVTARPIYARWEHAGTGEQAIYVSWHTNGYSGYQWDYRGTVSIVHNGEGHPITPGSEALRDAIHAELVHDLRAGWDPTWPGYTRSMNLGELRELWDDDPANALPGALIEIAYHDHPDDTDALKEPAFQLLAARAVYQGILHYFDPQGVELPEPPTHLMVRNAAGGRVRITWRPSPTDTYGLAGDPATGYRVYTSTDGLGWSSGVAVSSTTAYTLTGLAPEELLLVRVSATNAGGESFPTEVLAVRVGEEPRLLLVNGFDRLDQALAVREIYLPTGETHVRLLLDRMNRYDYAVQHGEALPLPFDSTSNEALQAGEVALNDYGMVDWILGEESTRDESLSDGEQALLSSFLDGGGSLFISGTEIGWDLDYLGSTSDRAFYNDRLCAVYAGDDAETYTAAPGSGSIFDGLPSLRFDAPGMYDSDWPDQLTPHNGAASALVYQGGGEGTAAVQAAEGCRRLVYLGFPFETLWPAQRTPVMERVLAFLDECALRPLETTISSPLDGALYEYTPVFAGTASGGGGVAGVEVAVCREQGACWDGTTWVTETVWLAASGSVSWTYTLPAPLPEGTYTLQARAWNAEEYYDPSPDRLTFRLVHLDAEIFLPVVFGVRFCTQVLADGGFEAGTGWVLNHRAVYDTAQVHSGARSMRVGIPPGETGGGAVVYSSVRQQVSLPAVSGASLWLWTYPIGEEGDTGDVHYVTLYDEQGGSHALDAWRSDGRSWQARTYDLSAYAGQTVTLYIGTKNDGDDDTAAMYVDDVSLDVCP